MSKQLSFVRDWFDSGVESGWIGPAEVETVRFLKKEQGELSDELRISIVFLSLFIKAGHTCLPLERSPKEWAGILGLDPAVKSNLNEAFIDVSALRSSPLVGSESSVSPLVLKENRLTFRRYWNYEKTVAQWIKSKTLKVSTTDIKDRSVEILKNLFPGPESEVNWQRIAAALSIIKPFLIISGGPGTGKTTTVARILALHRRLAGKRLNVALAAPTGKAAGRMGEALNRELGKLGLHDEELNEFPREAKTVHRLLAGMESHGLLPPVQRNQLPHDLVIVDEASMMDLSLMNRLIRCLGEQAKLILLGDKDQLASVEAGAVFADLCRKRENGFLPETVAALEDLGIEVELPEREGSLISDSIVYLTKSYRFDPSSGIGQLSQIVRVRNVKEESIESVFESYSDLKYNSFQYQKEDITLIVDDLVEKMGECSRFDDPQELLSFWKRSIWLMVLRHGLTGTERMNRLIEEQLASSRVVKMDNGWYHGRPVMITRNDYTLGVFNGDLGVAVQEGDGIWVHIESGSEVRRFKPHRLSHYNPAYFLTVHKSQGSEFDHVHLLLPQSDTEILTRELIYTAITRARSSFTLHGDLELFKNGLRRETLRFTGLSEMLYSD